MVTPASWVVVKARSKAERPWHLLSGQEMLPCCLCYGGRGSLKQHFMFWLHQLPAAADCKCISCSCQDRGHPSNAPLL